MDNLLFTITLIAGMYVIGYSIIKRESILDHLGLKWDHHPIWNLLAGFVISTITMTGIFLIEWLVGAIRITGVIANPVNTLEGKELSLIPALGLVVFLAFLEELFSRSMFLGGVLLVLKDRRWIAIVIAAALSGLNHAANPHASVISVIGNTLIGLMAAIAFVGSRRIWFPIGLHTAWNYVQGFIFGFPISGTQIMGIVNQRPIGPEVLTGGAYGPEAGLVGMIFGFVRIALVIACLTWVSKRQGTLKKLDYFEGTQRVAAS
jgi:uncharacterized protein